MQSDLWAQYAMMLKSRLFEEMVAKLWQAGLISGEMHLGTGEEAVIAGVVSQLREGDALALDHRATAASLMRGIDPVLLLREMLGFPDGLCSGMGGHMHLYSKEHLLASSGIVGASGPTAVGFALAAQTLRPGAIAVSFFGDGAMNQGMLLEAMNLASAWRLPVVFVCKNDGWAITTQSENVTGGNLMDRAHGFGLPTVEVDGTDVSAVGEVAHAAIERARSGQGSTFLHARCVHFEGHFLGFQLIRMVRDPLREMSKNSLPLTRSFLRPGGAALHKRIAGLKLILAATLSTQRDPRWDPAFDPIRRTRTNLESDMVRLQALENQVEQEVNKTLAIALGEVPA